jgi:hypothetical protein
MKILAHGRRIPAMQVLPGDTVEVNFTNPENKFTVFKPITIPQIYNAWAWAEYEGENRLYIGSYDLVDKMLEMGFELDG